MKTPQGVVSVFQPVRWHFQRLFAEGLIFCLLFYQEKSKNKIALLTSVVNRHIVCGSTTITSTLPYCALY
ncbi:hypothetical protein NLX65_02240 [Candidatus Cardinium sp. TP]|nr:hypothetical protein [Candidatus Cardinium sp. TP]